MSGKEWDATPWHDQRALIEGLDQDEDVPVRFEETGGPQQQSAQGPTIRENVDAGVDVIDISAMRDELEAARQRGGGG